MVFLGRCFGREFPQGAPAFCGGEMGTTRSRHCNPEPSHVISPAGTGAAHGDSTWSFTVGLLSIRKLSDLPYK
ncbi:unnamed protein product [Boreogadus saida]